MKFLGAIFCIAAFGAGIFFVLLPTIFTWSAVFDGAVAGILFSVLLFPIAILGYPIVILVAGLATGIGGAASVLAAVIGYAVIAAVIGLFVLGAWLWEKADEREYT